MYLRTLLCTLLPLLLISLGCDDDPQPTSDLIDIQDTDQDLDSESDTEVDTADTADTADQEATDVPIIGCQSSAECRDAGRPFCHRESGRCVECLIDAGCPFTQPICSNFACVPCANDDACRDIKFGPICNTATGSCVHCRNDDDCTSADQPFCFTTLGVCGACRSSFDCTDPLQPACLIDAIKGELTCTRHDRCTGDDLREDQSDDGPAGATPLVFTDGIAHITDGMICNSPDEEESDWFVATVENGDSLHITLTASSEDVELDLSAYDAQGLLLGESWYAYPEELKLTYLPAGPIYVVVTRFDRPDQNPATPYEIRFTKEAGACHSAADCAAEHANQLFRGHCHEDGACVRIIGHNLLEEGEPCDSPDDCQATCTYGTTALTSRPFQDTTWHWAAYTADADQRAICTTLCTDDLGCSGQDVCTTVFGTRNHCVAPCTDDTHCPVDILHPTDGGWKHLRCVDGHCR